MDKINKVNQAAYNNIADAYSKNTKELEEDQINQLEDFISKLPSSAIVLDLACGSGRDATYLSNKGLKVTGVDFSENMIEKAKSIAPKANFLLMDFTELDFEDESFDAVWFNAGLLCVDKIKALSVIKKIKSILKKDGVVFISVKEGNHEGFYWDKRYSVEKYQIHYDEEKLVSLLNAAGFNQIKLIRPNLKANYHISKWLNAVATK